MLLIPIKVKRKTKKFDLKSELFTVLKTNKTKLKKGDILVISSKYVSISDGRLINLKEVIISKKAKKGAPINAVTKPTGNSAGASNTLAPISAISNNTAPVSADNGSNNR